MIKNRKFKIILSIILFSIFYFLFSTFPVYAAELFFEPKSQEVRMGQQFQVDLFLDAKDEKINAIEGKIVFPKNLLVVKEILEGNSIINLWVEKPYLKDNEIIFSGIIPGGFKGVLSPYYKGYKPGKILSLIFQAIANGEGLITLKDTRVLLNDGLGTPTQSNISPFQFRITPEAPYIMGILPIKDPDPPEPFELTIAQDPNVFEGRWFLVFATQDKGSGISHYEVMERREFKILGLELKRGEWKMGDSPYLLKDQKLKSYIYVKAIDKAGNERIATLLPQKALLWYENYMMWAIIILGIIISYLILEIKKKVESRK